MIPLHAHERALCSLSCFGRLMLHFVDPSVSEVTGGLQAVCKGQGVCQLSTVQYALDVFMKTLEESRGDDQLHDTNALGKGGGLRRGSVTSDFKVSTGPSEL